MYYRYDAVKRYTKDGEIVAAVVGRRTNPYTGHVDYWVDAEWYGFDDEDFDTLEEACAFLEEQGFTEVTA